MNSGLSDRMQKLWQDPDFVAKQKAGREAARLRKQAELETDRPEIEQPAAVTRPVVQVHPRRVTLDLTEEIIVLGGHELSLLHGAAEYADQTVEQFIMEAAREKVLAHYEKHPERFEIELINDQGVALKFSGPRRVRAGLQSLLNLWPLFSPKKD